MIIKNNLKNLNFSHNFKIKYIIDEFFSLDMFRPINEKNYFNSYNLNIFKNKSFRTHVLGMGGSSLSSKLLGQFIEPSNIEKKLFFYDNPSPIRIRNLLSNLKIGKKDKFIFISKSGNTIETKYFIHLIISILKQKKVSKFYENFIFITEDKNNYMKNFAKKKNILCFDHDPKIGGRFSIFSITAVLPLISVGHSIDKILRSFNKAKKNFYKNHIKLSKTIFDTIAFEKKYNMNIVVGLSYHEKINVINEWYRQIFAESLGKNKNAINYISSYGSIDQHSQFQLYIDGPNDKNFIFFKIENKIKTIVSNSTLIKDNNLISILEEGAIKTLEQKKFMVSKITIKDNLDNYCYLLYFLIFDIYLRSKYEKINFLNQPAVEILKKNTKA